MTHCSLGVPGAPIWVESEQTSIRRGHGGNMHTRPRLTAIGAVKLVGADKLAAATCLRLRLIVRKMPQVERDGKSATSGCGVSRSSFTRRPDH